MVKQLSRYRKLVYIKSRNLPWPVSPRDVCLYGFGVDALEELGMVVVGIKSAGENEQEDQLSGISAVELPKLSGRYVRIDCKMSGYVC